MQRVLLFLVVLALLVVPVVVHAGVDTATVKFGSCAAYTVAVDYTRDSALAESVDLHAAVGGVAISPTVTWTIPAGAALDTYSRTFTIVFDAVQADSTVVQVMVDGLQSDTFTCSGDSTISFSQAIFGVADSFNDLSLGSLIALGAIVSGVGLLARRVVRAVR